MDSLSAPQPVNPSRHDVKGSRSLTTSANETDSSLSRRRLTPEVLSSVMSEQSPGAEKTVTRSLWKMHRVAAVSVITAATFTFGSQVAWATDPKQGPMNVSMTGEASSGINQSVFVATATNGVNNSNGVTATGIDTEPDPDVVTPLEVYAIPVPHPPCAPAGCTSANPITGGNNFTAWMPTPAGVDLVKVQGGGLTSEQGNLIPWGPQSGAEITVTQVGEGSRNITAKAVVPNFTGLTEAFFLKEWSSGDTNTFTNYAFHVFDADTRSWIDPARTGVQKRFFTVGANSFLEFIDPLVLPEASLGKNIRVGFVTWFYRTDWTDAPDRDENIPIPDRWAGLSVPVLMRASGAQPVNNDSAPEARQADSQPQAPELPVSPATAPPSRPIFTNPALVTAEQFLQVTPAQISLIPPVEFTELGIQVFAAMTPGQVAAMLVEQVNAIRPARAAALAPQAFAAFTPAQLAYLRPASVRAVPIAALQLLTAEQIASLRPDAIRLLSPASLRSLSTDQLASLTVEQRSQLSSRQVNALTKEQRRALGV